MADRVTVTRDSFLEPLGLGVLAARVRTDEEGDALWALTAEYARDAGAVGALPDVAVAGNELALRLPGGFSVNVGDLDKDELLALLGLAVVVMGASFPPASLSLGLLVMLRTRLKRLKAEYGERSVFDAVAATRPATAKAVTLALYGKPCRYPDAGCRFLDERSGTCGIGLGAVTETVTALVGKKVLRQLNNVEPLEYGVAL